MSEDLDAEWTRRIAHRYVSGADAERRAARLGSTIARAWRSNLRR